MKPPISLNLVQQVVRARVCANCVGRRPAGAESKPDKPRACEADCELFGSLRKLRDLAVHLDPVIAGFGRAAAAAGGAAVATADGRRVIEALRELTGRSVARNGTRVARESEGRATKRASSGGRRCRAPAHVW